LKKLNYILTFYSLIAILISCRQTEQKNQNVPNETINHTTGKLTLIDYKSDTLRISIGENYKLTDKIIDWRWAALADLDDKIDSTGIDAFLYLGEPLIKFNNGEWLPSLHIETDKNIITSFTCSILFSLEDKPTSVDNFLLLLRKDIKQLKDDKIVKSLKEKGFYETTKNDCVETFKLTKAKELENDRFEYIIKARQKNGR
jgi:hypothetical protein